MLTETMGQRRFRDPNMTWIKIDTLKNLPALVAFLDKLFLSFFSYFNLEVSPYLC